jgi:hypothetical protein
VNGRALLVPAGVVTVVSREWRVADRLTRKIAVMDVGLTTTTSLTVTPPPATVTVAGAVKLLPVMTTCRVAPRGPEFGASEFRTGFVVVAGVMVND